MMFFCRPCWLLRFLGILDLTLPCWYFQQKLPLLGKLVAKSLSWSKGMLSQMIILEKLTRDTQQLAPEMEKKNIGNLIIISPIKRELCFGPNHNLALQKILNFPLLTTGHASSHWSADKMTAFMDQHWW